MMNKISFVFVIVLAFCFTAFAQSEEMTSASPIEFQSAAYPMVAVESGLSGKVVVAANVDEKGNVTSADIYSGPGDVCPGVTRVDVVALQDSAKDAAMRTKFKPARSNGKPVASTVNLNFEFTPPKRSENDEFEVTFSAAPSKSGNRPAIKRRVLNNKALTLPIPNYPKAAQTLKAGGVVIVSIMVDKDGSVFAANSISGHPLLKETSRQAACKATFAPLLYDGKPIMVPGLLSYKFTP